MGRVSYPKLSPLPYVISSKSTELLCEICRCTLRVYKYYYLSREKWTVC